MTKALFSKKQLSAQNHISKIPLSFSVCGHLNEMMKITMDGSNTTSTLKLMPTAKDHDAELICLATNPVLAVRNGSIENNGTISSVETRRKLIVHCKAIISSLSVALA
jgi:hypothetical protein